jgi:hypothetical protein
VLGKEKNLSFSVKVKKRKKKMLATALVGGLVGAGIILNKSGRQPREVDNVRSAVNDDEQPNQRNAYHSERYYDTWNNEFALATKAFLQSQDHVNENVIPLYSNQMSLRQEMSPEMQAYIQKRGQRLQGFDTAPGSKRPTYINEGFGNEVSIQDSPMFLGAGFGGNAETVGPSSAEVSNRPYGIPGSTGITKEEHFQSYTVHGPVNSNDPNFHNNMVPFRKMRGLQNTDPEANQHRLELFTGQTGSVTEFRSKPKREMPSLTDRTPGQTFIYGAPTEMAVQTDRYITSNLKTDVTPFQQIRVGPGIAVGQYDAKPRDGFHSWYRPPDRNVDELRVNPKNVYEGRLLPGKEIVTNRGIEGDLYKNRPDRFYINDQRRWNKTTGSFTAPQIRENFVAYKQNREDTNIEYVGPAGNHENLAGIPGVYSGGTGIDNGGVCVGGELQPGQRPSDLLDRDAPADPELTGELESGGPCTLMSRVQATERQQLRAEPYRNFGAQSYLTGQTVSPYDTAKHTQKSNTHVRDYQGIASANADNHKVSQYFYDKAKHTQKSETFVRDYMGQVGDGSILKAQKYLDDKAKVTQKSNTFVRDYQGIVSANCDNQKASQYFYDKAKNNTRQTLNVVDYQGIVSANADNQKSSQYFYDKAKNNTRQTLNVVDYQGIVSANADNQKGSQYFYDQAKSNTRATNLGARDYVGVASANDNNRKAMKYYDDKARHNTRATVNVRDYTGIAGSVQTRNPVSYESMYAATTKNNQEALLEGRTYGPNKATNISVGACDINMQIKSRTGYDITRYGPNEDRQYQATPTLEANYGATTSQNQRSANNPYQPEDFVVEQFNRNPYTQSLQSATSLTSPFHRPETPFNDCAPNFLADPTIQREREKQLKKGAMKNE